MISRSVHMVRNPRGRYIVSNNAACGSGYTPESQKNFEAVIRHLREHAQGAKKVHISTRRMKLTFRQKPHGVSLTVHAMYALSVKTRRAPLKEARANGIKTTAMNELCTPPTRDLDPHTPYQINNRRPPTTQTPSITQHHTHLPNIPSLEKV